MSILDRILTRRNRFFLFKFYGLLSLVRWYNVLIISLALYLSAYYLLSPTHNKWEFLKDYKLHLNIIALSLYIMSGYIINAFYDLEKDIINKPNKAVFDRIISKEFSFLCYFSFNALAFVLSAFVSWKVLVVNFLFSLALWAYSHKMRKVPIMGEFGATFLTIAPFISISVYYWRTTLQIQEFILLIFIISLSREVIKKMIALKGDLVHGDRSIPIVFGEKRTRLFLSGLMFLSIILILFIIKETPSQILDIFLMISAFMLLANLIILMIKKEVVYYNWINRIYKLILLGAVLSIPLV